MGINISIEGMDNVLDGIQSLVSEQKIHNALAIAGEVVRAAAVDNCTAIDTGRLKGSITSRVEGNTAIIGTNVEYAAYVEFGTGSKGDPSVAHTTKKHWTYCVNGKFYTTHGQAPQAFLVPALKNNIEEIKAKFAEGYRNA